MKKRRCTIKSFIAVILTAVILVFSSFNTFAAVIQEPSVSPMWNNINDLEVNIIFDYETMIGTAGGFARKLSHCSHIEATLYLYQREIGNDDWDYVDEIYASKSVGTLALEIEFPCVIGIDYKAVLEVTAYANGVGEKATVEYQEMCF